MKILLIQLYNGGEVEAVYPIGLAYLSATLSAHDVRIIDQNICEIDPFSESEKILLDFSPDVVGISIRNIRLYSEKKGCSLFEDQLSKTIRAIKKIKEKTIIVAGGPAFSMFPLRFMKTEPDINFGIFLEGEESFPSLLENLESPEKVRGVFWRNGRNICFAGERIPPKFETLREPRRELIDPKKYKGMNAIGVQTKRGCALQCIYCSYPFLNKKNYRLRSPENVVDEIENLVNSYGIQGFTFVDSVFNIPLMHAKKICQEIINRDLQVRWSAWFNEKFMNEDFIDLAIKAGCREFELSPDGYSNYSLRWLNKNIQTRDIINTYRLFRKKSQIKIVYNFMMGIPGQDLLSLLRQVIFFLKLKFLFKGKLKGIRLNALWIEPNTVLEKIALEEGSITAETDLFNTTIYEVGIVRWIRSHTKRYNKLYSVLKSLRKRISFEYAKPK